jgi:Smg protein
MNTDQESLKFELLQAGFGDVQVNKAFDWLDGLALQKDLFQTGTLTENKTLRLFSDMEMEKLDTECRGFILFLEQTGVLDAFDREVVIDRIMALEANETNLQQLKWVVLMVLLNQPGKEAAFTWMEDIVLDDINSGLH